MTLAQLLNLYPKGKFTQSGWPKGTFIQLVEGEWVDEMGEEDADLLVMIGDSFYKDIWKVYTPPIKLTVNDIGKRIMLNSGYIGILLGYVPDSDYPFVINENTLLTEKGESEDGCYSIIEILG